MVSLPETDSDSPIGSDRGRGRDRNITFSTSNLNEYKETVSNMETRHWKMNIANRPSVKSVNRLVGMKMP